MNIIFCHSDDIQITGTIQTIYHKYNKYTQLSEICKTKHLTLSDHPPPFLYFPFFVFFFFPQDAASLWPPVP